MLKDDTFINTKKEFFSVRYRVIKQSKWSLFGQGHKEKRGSRKKFSCI